MEIYEKQLGKDHPNTVTVRKNDESLLEKMKTLNKLFQTHIKRIDDYGAHWFTNPKTSTENQLQRMRFQYLPSICHEISCEESRFVPTNFSLTYFIVSGEIENSGISAWLIVPECEGVSVLTAWAAGKFSGAHIAKFVKEIGL